MTVNLDPQKEEMLRLWDEAEALGIQCPWIGSTGGSELKLGNTRAISLTDLKAAHEGWFPRFMGN